MEERPAQTFPQRLIAERKRMGYSSQKAFAKALGVSPVTINFYERGERTPDYEMFARIAKLLEVSYDYMLGKSQHRTPEEKSSLEGTAKHLVEAAGRLSTEEATGSLETLQMIFDLCDGQEIEDTAITCVNDLLHGIAEILLNYRSHALEISNPEENRNAVYLYTELRKQEAQQRIELLPNAKHSAQTKRIAFDKADDSAALKAYTDNFAVEAQNVFWYAQDAVKTLIQDLQRQLNQQIVTKGGGGNA